MAEHKHDQKTQELYMQFQMINQQINELQKQLQMIEDTILELNDSKKGLEELSKQPNNKEILVPIVAGIFARAGIKDTKEFIVNVGANTSVAKSVEDVQKILDNQIEEMQKTQNLFIDNLHQLTMQAKELRVQLKPLIEK